MSRLLSFMPDAAVMPQSWKNDLLASVVVFLVALPLCMGIAIASGAPPVAGLISGIVGGLVVGFLTGSPLQVSGPAAGLAVVVFDIIRQHGLGALGIIVVVAGAIQLAAGIFRMGQWFRAVSPAVIQGMLAGIGVLIFASQFHVMVDDKPKEDGLANLASIPAAIQQGLLPVDGSTHHWAARIGIITILVIVLWKMFAPKKLKMIPAPLLAVTVATFIAAVLPRMGVAQHLADINYIAIEDNVLGSLNWLSVSGLQAGLQPSILLAGLAMALIASAETLLCAAAVDKMHSDPNARTRYDRELAAQGFGNMICGVLGGLPITGVIVRSSANVEAGARSRLSAIFHGAWLLLFVAMFPQVLRLIPTASLAAVLVYTGYKLVNIGAIRNLWAHGKGEVAIYAATLTVIVAKDLLTGVLVGIGLSAIKLLYTFSHLTCEAEDMPEKKQTFLRLRGAATFIRLPKLAACLENIAPDRELHVDLENLSYIDHACLDLLSNWNKQHEATGGTLVMDWGSLTRKFREANADPATPALQQHSDLQPVPS